MAPMKTTLIELDVPQLGKLTGICHDDDHCQYLGIPYATVPGRFRRPKPLSTPWPGGKLDGTKLSPYPSQPSRDFYPIPSPVRPWVKEPSPGTSSTECLTLNISVPTTPAKSKGGYSVMVFFHGGAFVYAAGGAPIYDGRAMSELSKRECDMPTIVVSPNFRLGFFGFLASKEIREYNEEFGEDGVGNYGLWDQIEALRWIQKNIAAFGGDPSKVCCFGQSAGGESVNVHLLRGEKLFSSAIIQSGLLPLCGLMTVEEYQVLYEKCLDVLGIPNDLSPRDRLQRLIDIDEAEIVKAMPKVCIIPVVSLGPCDDFVLCGDRPMPRYADYKDFAIPSWCERVMIGDVRNEGMIWNKSYRNLDATALITKINKFAGSAEKAKLLMELYEIHADMTHDETFWKIEQLATDGLFVAVDWLALKSWPKMYAYRFDVPSPFDNDWCGIAHHSLDNVYIWSLLRDKLPPKQRKVSVKMLESWIKFANGVAPWPRFDEDGQQMVFHHDGCDLRTLEQDAHRGYAKWDKIIEADMMNDFHRVADEICMHRSELLDPSWPCEQLTCDELIAYGIQRKPMITWE